MTDHAPVLCRNRLLFALPLTELSQLRPQPMRVQQVNGQRLYEAGNRIKQAFYVEQSFASMVTVADTDADLLRTVTTLQLVENDELVRECLSEKLTDRTKENAP